MAEKRMTLPPPAFSEPDLKSMHDHADEQHPVPQKSYIGRMIDAAAGLATGGPTNAITKALNGPDQQAPAKRK